MASDGSKCGDGGGESGKPCPGCGRPMCGIPLIDEHEFVQAKELAELVWSVATLGPDGANVPATERTLGVLLTAAALITKRAARALGVTPSREALGGLALIMLDQTRAMILGRRARAEQRKAAN